MLVICLLYSLNWLTIFLSQKDLVLIVWLNALMMSEY